MGLFSKLKDNFKHGGVKVSVNGPTAIKFGDPQFAAAVTVTAGDSAQTIKSLTLTIVAISTRPVNYNDPNHTNDQLEHTVAQVSDNTVFTLQPGETKTVTVPMPLNNVLALPDNAFGKIVGALENGQLRNERYQLQARADVEGIALDPSAHQAIQLTQ